ncbi:MAG: hypothetical protein H6815_00455 [Phycisphaeraceae bacterium]|nr:hypothetical protein [Phycisphaerales bacterium]MCB9858895.1 hypothetical protein [Phycisphaeraceae bacterium]
MPSPTMDLITDLNESTLPSLRKNVMMITQEYDDYPLTKYFLERGQKAFTGTREQVQCRLSNSGTAKFVGPYEVRSVSHKNLIQHYEQDACPFDDQIIISKLVNERNAGKEKIVDMLMTQMDDKFENLYNLCEEGMASAPYTHNDTQSLWGLPAMLPYLDDDVVDPIGGYNAMTTRYGDGSTSTLLPYSTIDRSLTKNRRARTMAATHGGVFDPVLNDTLRRLLTRSNFKTLTKYKVKMDQASGGDRIYTSHELVDGLESYTESAPDDWKGDSQPSKGMVAIRGIDIQRVAAFGDLTEMPIFGVRHRFFQAIVPKMENGKKRWMHINDAMQEPRNPNISYINIDNSINTVCLNFQRAGFNCHKPILSS